MKITMEGKYQTRGGLLPSVPVRLLCLDGPRDVYPAVGIVERREAREICEWTAGGLWLCGGPEGEHDLVPVPTKHEGWVIIPDIENIRFFTTKDYAEGAMYAGQCQKPHQMVVLIKWED